MNYINIVPLIGGMMLGNYQEIGKKPDAFLSYPAFKLNDSHVRVNFPDIPYVTINEGTNQLEDTSVDLSGVDFVSTLCPCAGLSMLNNGNRGPEAEANDWLYKTSEFTLNNIKPQVFWGENAPNLFTDSGKPVADKLFTIAKKYNYSFSIVKTSTIFHGIPQNRVRSFYFFWKSETAPIFEHINRPHKKLLDYLNDIPDNSLYTDIYPNDDFNRNGILKWFIDNVNESEINSNFHTVIQYVEEYDLHESLIEYLEENSFDESYLKFAKLAYSKYKEGKNVWDNSPLLLATQPNYTNAIQGRTFKNAVHPNNHRYLNIREHMHLMGMPHDYQLKNTNDANQICQNVPVQTAADWTNQVVKFINGELKQSDSIFIKYNNIKDEHTSVIHKPVTKLF